MRTAWNKGLTKKTHPQLSKSGVKKGNIPWNKCVKTGIVPKTALKKGDASWNKGNVGYRAGIRRITKGFKHTEETKKKMSESHLGEKAYQWKGGKPKCIDCGETKKSYRGDKCSRCAGVYKGGVTSINQLERVKFRKTIQKKVFERDDYTCQLCGERGGKIQVDHIQPWSEYVELRFDINNCRTLCMSCHYEITFSKPMPKQVISWGHNFKGEVQ